MLERVAVTTWRPTRVLERVALGVGEREGTKPEDDPLMRSQSAKARTEGHARGRMEFVVAALRARSIEAALETTEDRALLGGLSGDALMAAALAYADAADFRRRIRKEQGVCCFALCLVGSPRVFVGVSVFQSRDEPDR